MFLYHFVIFLKFSFIIFCKSEIKIKKTTALFFFFLFLCIWLFKTIQYTPITGKSIKSFLVKIDRCYLYSLFALYISHFIFSFFAFLSLYFADFTVAFIKGCFYQKISQKRKWQAKRKKGGVNKMVHENSLFNPSNKSHGF